MEACTELRTSQQTSHIPQSPKALNSLWAVSIELKRQLWEGFGSKSMLKQLDGGRVESKNPEPPVELPAERGNDMYRTLRWRAFTPYRRLFFLILVANATALSFVCWNQRSQSRLIHIQIAVTANIFSSIAFRNEHLINNLFRVFIVFNTKKAPFWWRRFCAKVYCFGGIHSGTGAAATVWYLAFTILLIKDFISEGGPATKVLSVVLAICTWTLLVIILGSAMPHIRNQLHNSFEQIHRFCGWTVLGLFWAETMVLGSLNAQESHVSLGYFLLHSASFWLLTIATLFVIYPWLQLRYVAVEVEQLSNHAIRIWFGRHYTHAKQAVGCRTIRIAIRPLTETHSFAVIPERNKPEYSIIVSRAGDFTKRIIEHPPRKIWIKGMPTWGVLRVATLFDPVVIVATGSGIGPCLGLFNEHENLSCRILWSARAPLTTYGQGIYDMVRRADPNAVILDTNVDGHPDMVQSVYELYKKSGAEAVVIISNPRLTYMLCQKLESRAVPTFGPIWDS